MIRKNINLRSENIRQDLTMPDINKPNSTYSMSEMIERNRMIREEMKKHLNEKIAEIKGEHIINSHTMVSLNVSELFRIAEKYRGKSEGKVRMTINEEKIIDDAWLE